MPHRTPDKGCRFGHWVPAPPANCPDRARAPYYCRTQKIPQAQNPAPNTKSELLCAPAWCDFAPPGAPVFSFCVLIKERRARVCAPRETHSNLQPFEGLRTSSFQMGSHEKDRRICFTQAVRRPSSPSAGEGGLQVPGAGPLANFSQTWERTGGGGRGRNGAMVRTWKSLVPRSDFLDPITLQSPRELQGPRLQKELPRDLSEPLSGIQDAWEVVSDPRRKIQARKRSVGGFRRPPPPGCSMGLKRSHLSRPPQRVCVWGGNTTRLFNLVWLSGRMLALG